MKLQVSIFDIKDFLHVICTFTHLPPPEFRKQPHTFPFGNTSWRYCLVLRGCIFLILQNACYSFRNGKIL